jgi:Flp pilus assembly protein TadD
VKQARELCVGVNNFTRDKLQLAEQLARKATEQNPAAAETWSVLGYINMTYIMRGYDKTPARFEAVRSYANRALALAPEQSEACLTLGIMTGLYDGDRVVAERYYQRALKADPSDNRVRRYYSQLLIFSKRAPEAIALLREGVKMHPEDVLVRYELVVQNLLLADYPAAWKEAQAMLEIQSFGSGWTLKAMLCAQWKGDLPAMRLALDRLSQEEKTEDRPVYLLMWCALAERKPELALESARLTPREFLEDNYFTGPKTWLTARAHALLGQDNLAMLDYVLAETVIRARLARNPGGQDDRLCLAITLALAGRIPEARQEMAPLEAAAQEQPSLLLVRRLAQYYGALGETSRAVAYLRQHDKRADSSFTAFTPSILRLDPWWDKLRGQAEFETLLNDPAYCAWSR